MTIPTDTDERMGQFHAEAQKLVWGWMESSKVKVPIADTMDPLSCLTYAITQHMEKVYQEAQKPPEKPQRSKFFGMLRR